MLDIHGIAQDILVRLKHVIEVGIENRHIQRLPHTTLLNTDFYRSHMMHVLAEWSYLWLQKQHLHGIDRLEAVRYMIEGAATMSDSIAKLSLIELALKKVEVQLGQSPGSGKFTSGYSRSMSDEEREQKMAEIAEKQRNASANIQQDRYVCRF